MKGGSEEGKSPCISGHKAMFLPKSSEAAFFLAMLPSTSSIEQDKNRLCWATDRVQNESVLVYQMGSQHANGVKCAHPPPTPAVKPLQMPLFQGGAVPRTPGKGGC